MADVTAEYDIVGGNAPDKFTIIAGELRETVAENVNLSDALVFVAAGNAATTIAEQTGSTPEAVAREIEEAFALLRIVHDWVRSSPKEFGSVKNLTCNPASPAGRIELLLSRIQRDKTDG